MKNNSVTNILVFVIGFVVAVVYSVLYYLGIFPAVSATVSNGVTLALVVLASLAAMPVLCKEQNECVCRAVKNYLPAVIFGAVGAWVTSGFLPLVTVSTRLSYVLAQFVAVFFGAFLPVVWGLYLHDIITATVCKCHRRKKDCGEIPAEDNCIGPGYNKFDY